MGSETQAAKLPPADPTDKEHYPLSTGRAHSVVRKLIDRAALELNVTRADFLLEAGADRAVTVLGEKTAREILRAA